MHFSLKAMELLQRLDWTGNIRELQNLIECIVQIYSGDVILPEYIMDNVSHQSRKTLEGDADGFTSESRTDEWNESAALDADTSPVTTPPVEHAAKHRKKFTQEDLLAALRVCGNNRSAAAEYLGISRRTMYRKLEEFYIQ